jgi:hypothetical protein
MDCLQDLRNDFIRNSHPERINVCRCCGEEYERGEFDFYSLCSKCFYTYDEYKYSGLDLPLGQKTFYSSEQWLASKKGCQCRD